MCDGLLIGLRGTIKYAIYHYDETVRAVANKLTPVFEHYGELEKRSYPEETAAITSQEAHIAFANELNQYIDKINVTHAQCRNQFTCRSKFWFGFRLVVKDWSS